MALAGRAAANAPLTNFALIHALPRIAESDPAAGYVAESLMAAVGAGRPGGEAAPRRFPGEAGREGDAGLTSTGAEATRRA